MLCSRLLLHHGARPPGLLVGLLQRRLMPGPLLLLLRCGLVLLLPGLVLLLLLPGLLVLLLPGLLLLRLRCQLQVGRGWPARHSSTAGRKDLHGLGVVIHICRQAVHGRQWSCGMQQS